MKGVVIFDERADLAFYCLDDEMEKFILGRMQELEMEHTKASVRTTHSPTSPVSQLPPSPL